MNTERDIVKMLEHAAPTLREEESAALWQRIESKITTKAIPSPFFSVFTLNMTRMSVAAFALIVVLGVGSTTAAAQQSRPGDILFPVERALEEVRLALASNDTARASLQLEFAEERLAELRSLIEESPKTSTPEITRSASSTLRFSGEADVFSDVTIVSVEIDDRKTSFRTELQTREDLVEEIALRYGLSLNLVDAGLDFEIEDRASRVSDIDHSDNDDERIGVSMKLLSSLVDDIGDDERKRFVNEVLKTLDYDSDARVEIRDDEDDEDDDEERIEIRSGDERVRIREKNGEVRIDIKSDDSEDRETDDDEDARYEERSNDDDNHEFEDSDSNEGERDEDEHDEDSDDKSDDESDSDSNDNQSNDDNSDDEDAVTQNVDSIEVRVDEGEAEVRISYDNDEDRFILPYISRAALVSAISIKTGLAETIVEDKLDIEIKD